MSKPIKLVLYVVCLVAVIVLGSLTLRSYREATQASERHAAQVNADAPGEGTNTPALTNLAATNLVATNVAATNTPARAEAAAGAAVAGASSRGYTRMVTYGLGLLLFFIGLAALIAWDVSQFLGSRAEQALFTEDGPPEDPEYDQAEEMWKDGKYLDALNAMRSYLNKNPREQHVALRIAEIYEQNLNNPLAAALEYEEVLKKKLPPERWGWAAIHLANLYSGKLGQPEKSVSLLRRIDAEYGQTSAAKKARERLTQIDPNFVPAAAHEEPAPEEPATEEPAPPPPPPSNLPPGFRPKTKT